MTSYIALLRAVNVGGRNVLGMSRLRGLVADLGFENVRILLQSGNVVFSGPRKPPAALEKQLEGETANRLGLTIDCFVRTAAEWNEIIERNPFRAEAKRDPSHLVVVFLKSAVPPKNVRALQTAIVGREMVRGAGRELYIVYPDGIGRSKLTGAVAEKAIGIPGTARNWNTVLKLADACR